MLFLLKISIGLAVTWLFYTLLLRRLTFYRWNRLFLLVYPAITFLVPLIDISDLLQHQPDEKAWIQVIPVLDQYAFGKASDTAEPVTASAIGWALLAAGILIMAIRLTWQYWSLRKAVSGAVLLADDEARLYHVNKRIMPFSFGRSIYLNKYLHSEEELQDILRHEFIHVKQRHSLDIFWGELICVLNWYNPFAWLLRKAIRQNLEFIADHQVLANGVDRKQYQYLLLKVTGMASFSVANNFNLSSLKKRITMMNKKTSAGVHLLRFVLIVPVLAVVLLAFRSVVHPASDNASLLTAVQFQEIPQADTIPAKYKKAIKEGLHIYIKDGKAVVTKQNGHVEKYDLNKPDEKKAYIDKYGEVPPPPPAPPAPPAPAPKAPPAAPGTPALKSVPTPPAPPAPPVPLKLSGEVTSITFSAIEPENTGAKLEVGKKLTDSEAKVVAASFGQALAEPATGQAAQPEPLYVIDGIIQTPGSKLPEMPADEIARVSVLKGQTAIAVYGEAGRNGVVEIVSKAAADVAKEAASVKISRDSKKNMISDLCKLNAIFLIDDKEYNCDEAKAYLTKKDVTIVAVNVMKTAAVVKAKTGKIAEHAVQITTKRSS